VLAVGITTHATGHIGSRWVFEPVSIGALCTRFSVAANSCGLLFVD